MKKLLIVGLVVLAVVCWCVFLREPSDDGTAAAELARDRTAAFFEAEDLDQARATVAPLIEGPDAAVEDLERAAVIAYHDRADQDPGPLFERLRSKDPQNATLHYMLAQMSVESGEYEAAPEHYRTVLRSEPDDLASRFGLAIVLDDLGEVEEAEELLRSVAEVGVEHGGY